MEEKIVVSCPSCQVKARVPIVFIGKSVRCPSCKNAFEVIIPNKQPQIPQAEPDPKANTFNEPAKAKYLSINGKSNVIKIVSAIAIVIVIALIAYLLTSKSEKSYSAREKELQHREEELKRKEQELQAKVDNKNGQDTNLPTKPNVKELAKDVEVKGTWKFKKLELGSSCEAEGTVTNTGDYKIPKVIVTATFKGAALFKIADSHYDEVCKMNVPNDGSIYFDSELIVAVGSEEFRNVRPGETRSFTIIPNGMDQGCQRPPPDTEMWDSDPQNCIFDVKISD